MAVVSGRAVATGRAVTDVASGTSDNSVSQREDLANFISMITRDETPFMSSIGKTKATAIYHEWQTDELAPPSNSRIGEGTDYNVPTGYTTGGGVVTGTGQPGLNQTGLTAQSVNPAFAYTGPNRTRLGNYTQINGKTIAVSGTRRAIDQAGVADEYAYQLKKRGTEMRRDVERDLIHTYQRATTTSPGARQMGGYQSWINDPRTVNFASASFTPPASGARGEGSASIQAAATPVGGALSLSDIDGVMQKIYEEGGKASKIMLSPKLRRDFSDLMVTDSGVRRNIDMDGKLRQSVDVYMSDFGDLMVVPNYIMGLTQMTVGGAGGDTGTSFNAANTASIDL